MKIRHSFVSNSSSSSFIVAFDKPIKTLKDVLEVVPNPQEARRILTQIKEQEPHVMCSPPQPECASCELRFRCFTGGRSGVIEALHRWNSGDGYDEEDEEEGYDIFDSYYSNLIAWAVSNKGKVAYFLNFADSGEGGDDIDSQMRYDADRIFSNLPYKDVT